MKAREADVEAREARVGLKMEKAAAEAEQKGRELAGARSALEKEQASFACGPSGPSC